jgi:murein DD-endopeptidase MepM/ murein hydrolase activator NlpD
MKTRWLLCLMLVGMLWLPVSAQDAAQQPGVTIHVVQRGETLFRIARQYGLTVDELARLNGITNPGNILVGQRLLVPTGEVRIVPPQHVVQPGETLDSISALYGISVEDLAARNQIADGQVYIGQTLTLVPSLGEPPAVEADTAVEEAIRDSIPLSPVIHTVLRGETLFRIAQQYGITVNALAAANSITDPELIYSGQQLIIPGVEPPQLAAALPAMIRSLEAMPLILIEGQTGRFRMFTTTPVTVSGTFLNQALIAASEDNGTKMTVLMGVPVGTSMGVYPLSLNVTDSAGVQTPINANVRVAGGHYPSEYLNVLADRLNLLNANADQAELAILRSVMSAFNPQRYFDGPMGLPAAAPITSPFGVTRTYNGGAYQSLHTGTDFAGAPGSAIFAPASGRVVLADNLNIRGTATVIDHGWGVYSGYWHQSERYVQVGEFVTTGQVIGAIGSTGRVTGAHLHWEIWVNGVPVDPMQWARLSFS